jgi:hypothetical protein
MGLFLLFGLPYSAHIKIENPASAGISWLRFVIPTLLVAENGFDFASFKFGFVCVIRVPSD